MYRALGIALAAAVFGAACSGGVDRASEALGSAGSVRPWTYPTLSVSGSTSASGSQGPGPSNPGGRPIVVESPLPGDEVLSPVVVRGRAISADGQVGVHILDADGLELAAVNVDVSCGSACQGEFRAELAFFVPVTQVGKVQVRVPGSNGTAEHLVEIAVTLVPGV